MRPQKTQRSDRAPASRYLTAGREALLKRLRGTEIPIKTKPSSLTLGLVPLNYRKTIGKDPSVIKTKALSAHKSEWFSSSGKD